MTGNGDSVMGAHTAMSSLASSKLNSPLMMSRVPSSSALTSAISIPGQTTDLQLVNSHGSDNSQTNILSSKGDKGSESLKLAIICVGLPATGKSYITKKLQRYLNWMQYNTKIFNVGNTRRQENAKPSDYPIPGPTIDKGTSHDASFFDHTNTEYFHRREQWARETLDDLIDFLLVDQGNVGIFDATNSTKDRRSWIIQTLNEKTNGAIKILFLESICTDQELVEKNIRLKLSGPDYKDMDRQVALDDFRNRLRNYQKVYETIDEEEEKENEIYDIQYVKIINAGKKVISYNISGYLSSQCVFFLLNFNLTDRQIWLTASGESEFNALNKKGGDSNLTKNGDQFARALPKFICKKRQEFKLRHLNKEYVNDEFVFHTKAQIDQEFNIWTSNLRRTLQTASHFPREEEGGDFHIKSFRMLNDFGCGSLDSIGEDEFRTKYPDEYRSQMTEKLTYRYPGLGGESYLDVISRLRPIIIELERLRDHVLIISHRVITRVLLCYFMNLNKEMLTELDVQHGYVYCIEPKPYGLDLKIWQYDEVTDDFYEVDEIGLMKKKRKRVSISIGGNFRPIIRKSASPDSSVSSSEYSSSSDEEESVKARRDITPAESEAYEFSRRPSDTASDASHTMIMDPEAEIGHQVEEILKNEKLVELLRKRLEGVAL
ncbi:hypothetical protein OGAPHI_002436 [Ogataea philodendri]|uniref:6-phosphofructo-2-kinase domain-containing protein n=1 Tax=Ogataea philodendri TaxID=1378263 RepID=A0A9P8PCC4_9ASCO|nr:uncharacterized protein OGAPHI_002436 [Ogataea philodendri]KAH3668682.1 hypothetical protein OGAPHI_002436 [Ogataea philodendri]